MSLRIEMMGGMSYADSSACRFVFKEEWDNMLCFYYSRDDDVNGAEAIPHLKTGEFCSLKTLSSCVWKFIKV